MANRPPPVSKTSAEHAAKPVACCPVVGVGASAGGLEAFTALLKHLPGKTGFAFALVQHLDPKQPSHLTAILARGTKMPVLEAKNGATVEPDHVYIIPPNVSMRIADGVLHLSPRKGATLHLPIDEFFQSLAEDCKNKAIGVVLSGNASDGTLGLQMIKEAGGITFAQDEASARYEGMPRSAAASGCVDFILPPEKIAEELKRISAHPYVTEPTEGQDPPTGDGLAKIFALVRGATGVDFHQYKQTTVGRRIQRRMIVHRMDHLDAYATFLQNQPREVEALYEDALIHVTSFFREPESFAAMAKTVFPALAKGRKSGDTIRLWLPGCSTGEEAFSMAISLAEFFEGNADAPAVQIFGTDVSESVIARARKGIFDASIGGTVSEARLERFFTKTERGWQVNKSIRDMCIFARQNVIKDPPFSKLDLVSCRNVLIYFEQATQKKIIPIFHYSLRPGGFLLLGSAESIGVTSRLFECLDQKHKIFVKRAMALPPPLETGTEMPERPAPPAAENGEKEIWTRLDAQKEADRLLIARFCPPAIVFGEDMEIIQFRGRVAPFIEPAPGEASLNLFRMLRPALEVELRTAITRVKKTGAVVRKENVVVNGNGPPRCVNLEVMPLGASTLRERCFVVLFEEVPPKAPAAKSGTGKASGPSAAGRVTELEQELVASKEHLQSVSEEHEAINEELGSANEEIQSANEELQSTNEELETAQEELQSTNEELTTVNDELKHTNVALAQLNDDLSNLLRSLNMPIVMLGRDLRIRHFTPGAERLLRLRAGDVGRPITDLRTEIDLPDLEKMVRQTIDLLSTQEMEVRDHHGRWYLLQVRPYETADNKITGAVMILFDIDASKRLQEQSDLAAAYAEAFIETVRNALVVLGADLRVKRATELFYETFDLTPRETEGQLLYELGRGQWDIPKLRGLLEEVLPQKTSVHGFKVEHDFARIGHKRLVLNARRIERDINGEPLILLSIEEQRAQPGE